MERFVSHDPKLVALVEILASLFATKHSLWKIQDTRCKGCQFVSKCSSYKKILKITQAVETSCYQSAYQNSLILKKKSSKLDGAHSKSRTLKAHI